MERGTHVFIMISSCCCTRFMTINDFDWCGKRKHFSLHLLETFDVLVNQTIPPDISWPSCVGSSVPDITPRLPIVGFVFAQLLYHHFFIYHCSLSFALSLRQRRRSSTIPDDALHAIRRQGGPKVCPTNGVPPSSLLYFSQVVSPSTLLFVCKINVCMSHCQLHLSFSFSPSYLLIEEASGTV